MSFDCVLKYSATQLQAHFHAPGMEAQETPDADKVSLALTIT